MQGALRIHRPEIWEQTDGKVDGFICSVGTGGTLAGASRYLKEKHRARQRLRRSAWLRDVRAVQARHRQIDARRLDHRGHRTRRVTPVIETAKVDDAFLIPDEEAVKVIYELLEHEGRASVAQPALTSQVRSGCEAARAGKTIVTILADSGNRYQSKLFNRLHAFQESTGAGMAGEAQRHQCAVRKV